MSLPPGTSFGRYEVLSQLGAGGMGEVYLAHDAQLNRKVALKVLPADLISNRERLRRFEQEARAASALNQPNIITIHEIGAEGDRHFIATEFIAGETLRRKLQTTRLEIEETLNIAIQIAAALDAAHRSGIVHRDIKPENVMLREDGLVKVLDFGLAKLTEKKDDTPTDTQNPTRALVNTNPGVVMGTVAYMSPEQARGLALDARTDIFSLGVCLYEMLTGRLPFAGETTSDVLAAILKTAPAPLDENTPAELQRIVRKSLQKKADERYQTAKDLLIDLKTLKRDLDFTAELERSGIPTKSEQSAPTQDQSIHTTSSAEYLASGIKQHKGSLTFALAVLLPAALGFGYWFFVNRSANTPQIESIAVLPFRNDSGETEYLSDGMTETLISSLSQIPKLNVKARSAVFRYKGKETDAQTIGKELNVQTILTGRVVQRGDELTLSLSLEDVQTGNQIWGKQYNRKLTGIIALQTEIARDVSDNLKTKLSGADKQRVAKNYTVNPEAYQLYLKGRNHVGRGTPSEIQRGISYYQQAIEIDPNYALAYIGLADAYFKFWDEIPTAEVHPKAKAAANKAIEIDDTLAEAHSTLSGISFWYDWDFNAAERHIKRALELNPNGASIQRNYAGHLSNTGRQAEAIPVIRRAIELDPSNLEYKAMQGLILIRANQNDEGLAVLQKILEQEPGYSSAHSYSINGYTKKGMFPEAVASARRAREFSNNSPLSIGFLAQILGKAGKRAEAQAAIEELLKLSNERYVSPYSIAAAYNGLEERDQTFVWLERGFVERDPRMAMLPIESKWDNLRSNPRFQGLLRRVGFTP